MENPKNMLVFLGKPGIGKTHACAAMTHWILKNFNTHRVFNENYLLARLRNSIAEGRGDYHVNLQNFIDDELIIMNDVGSGINPDKITYKDLEWRREIFFDFLDSRYNSMLPTIITSNFTRKNFEDVYSERISSRLFSAENTIIELFGDVPDLRQLGM